MPLLLAIISSRVGQMAAAALVGAIWAWWASSTHCTRVRAQEAAERDAANMMETARQMQVARELAEEATSRLVEEQDAVRQHKDVIDKLVKDEGNDVQTRISYKGRLVYISDRPCGIDPDFRDRLRKLRP